MKSGPIVLVGLPRSGTTWIGKIFDSHPDTLYLHEPDSAVPMKEIPLIVPAGSPELVKFDASLLSAVIDRTLSVRLGRVAAHLPRFRKSYRHPALELVHSGLGFGAKVWARYFGELSLPDLAMKSPPHPVRIVWKSIESLGRVGLLARVMPEARIIHILRHPGGQIASRERGLREGRFQWDGEVWWLLEMLRRTSLAQRRGLSMDAFRAMRPIEVQGWIWALFNDNALESCYGFTNVLAIRYEEVCADPIGQARKMFDFARLAWSDRTQVFVRRSISTNREGFYSVFRDPLIAATKWAQQIKADDAALLLAIMHESMAGRLFIG